MMEKCWRTWSEMKKDPTIGQQKAAFKEKIQYKTKPFKELLLTHYSFAKRVENDRLGSLRM